MATPASGAKSLMTAPFGALTRRRFGRQCTVRRRPGLVAPYMREEG
jgi:hypothetical protein